MKNSEYITRISFGTKLLVFVSTLIIGFGFVADRIMRDMGNESDAQQFIYQTNEKQKRYFNEHRGVYASNFSELHESFEGETVHFEGYVFTIKTMPPTGIKPAFYSINADPQNYLWFIRSESRHFYFDSTLVTTHSTEENRQANADDPTI